MMQRLCSHANRIYGAFPHLSYSESRLHLHHTMTTKTLAAALAALSLTLAACGGTPEPKSKNLGGNEVGQRLVMGLTGCERTLKKMLRDPESLQRDEYIVTEASPTAWAASMSFRARNGFSGINQMQAVCTFDGTQYTVQLVGEQ